MNMSMLQVQENSHEIKDTSVMSLITHQTNAFFYSVEPYRMESSP